MILPLELLSMPVSLPLCGLHYSNYLTQVAVEQKEIAGGILENQLDMELIQFHLILHCPMTVFVFGRSDEVPAHFEWLDDKCFVTTKGDLKIFRQIIVNDGKTSLLKIFDNLF